MELKFLLQSDDEGKWYPYVYHHRSRGRARLNHRRIPDGKGQSACPSTACRTGGHRRRRARYHIDCKPLTYGHPTGKRRSWHPEGLTLHEGILSGAVEDAPRGVHLRSKTGNAETGSRY